MLDVPRKLVRHLARLLAAERRALGTRRDTRALTCFYQALLVLVWFRKYSGKHRDFGANIQAVMLPNGLPI